MIHQFVNWASVLGLFSLVVQKLLYFLGVRVVRGVMVSE